MEIPTNIIPEEYLKSVEYRIKDIPFYRLAKRITETKYEDIEENINKSMHKNKLTAKEFNSLKYVFAIPFVIKTDIFLGETTKMVHQHKNFLYQMPSYLDTVEIFEEQISNFQNKFEQLVLNLPQEVRNTINNFDKYDMNEDDPKTETNEDSNTKKTEAR